ncbi:hypothetical protein D3C81_1785670 [compost metagenome]
MVVLLVDACPAVLAAGFDVVFIAGRNQIQVTYCVGYKIAFGLSGTGDDINVTSSVHSQVATAFHRRRKVFHGGGDDGAMAAIEHFVQFVFVARRQQVDVAGGAQAGVAAAAD